jgi:DNA topoisomerase-2
MTSCGAPSIEAVAGDAVSSSTKVTFQPDMSRFGMGALDAGTLAVMRRRVLDVAGTTRGGLVVTLNGETVGVSDFPGYMALFPAQEGGSAAGAAAPAVAYLAPNKRWEIGVTLSPDATFQSVSFVNGVSTHRGGSHVNAVADLLVKKLLPIVVKKTGGVGKPGTMC